ncbi:hypothetical protein [Paraburkholderia lacunae]|uniref:hypothetical protein n=1 Tax=Paraburkholderia lacunae TaxID=2211104 RepID=UPI003CC61A91
MRTLIRTFLYRRAALYETARQVIRIDGKAARAKFKAVNHRDRNFTSAKLERRTRDIESSIARYLAAMDTADRQEPAIAKARTRSIPMVTIGMDFPSRWITRWPSVLPMERPCSSMSAQTRSCLTLRCEMA